MTLPPLRVLCASVVIVTLAAYFAFQYLKHQQTLQLQQAEYQQAQAFLRRLDQPVKLNFGSEVTVQEWLAEWSRQTGITIQRAEGKDFFAEAAQRHVRLDLPETSGRNALQALADLEILHWNPVDNEGIEICYEEGIDNFSYPREVVRHALPPDLIRSSPAALDPLLGGTHFSVYPDFNASSPFAPSLIAPISHQQIFHSRGQIIIVQPVEAQQRVADFLRSLQLALKRTSSLPSTGVLPDDPRLQPLLLSHGPEQIDLLPQLEQPVTVVMRDIPLSQFTAELTRQTGVQFCINAEQLRGQGRAPETPITCELKHVRLQAALARALGRRNLSYRLLASSAQVVIGDVGVQFGDDDLCTIAYPVADLLTAGRESEFVGKMTTLVNDGGGYFRKPCELHRYEHLLIARLPLADHWVLQDLLVAVRQVRSGLAGPRLQAGVPGEHVEGLVTEVFDLRPCTRFSPIQASTIGRLIEELEQANALDWNDVRGTTAVVKDTLVLRNSPAVIDQAWNLLEFLRAELQTGRPVWPGRGELRGDALNKPLFSAHDPKERNEEYPWQRVYFVGDLLEPRGKLSHDELLTRCGLEPEDSEFALDPFGPHSPAVIHLNRLLVVRFAAKGHEKLQAALRALRTRNEAQREEASP